MNVSVLVCLCRKVFVRALVRTDISRVYMHGFIYNVRARMSLEKDVFCTLTNVCICVCVRERKNVCEKIKKSECVCFCVKENVCEKGCVCA